MALVKSPHDCVPNHLVLSQRDLKTSRKFAVIRRGRKRTTVKYTHVPWWLATELKQDTL